MKRSTIAVLLIALAPSAFVPAAAAQTTTAPAAAAAPMPAPAQAPETAAPPPAATAAAAKPSAGAMPMGDAMAAKPAAPPSKSLVVSFNGQAIELSVADLLKLPQLTINVRNGHTNRTEIYTGPLVSDVLAKAGLAATDANHALILHSAVVATGTDGYFVLYSGGEVEGMFASGKVIVAVMKSGLPNTDGGNIQLVDSADVKPARWVNGLSGLAVNTLGPVK